MLVFLFAEFQLLEVLSVSSDCFIGFVTKVWSGYQDNPYHNKIHSYDVTQTTHFFVHRCKLNELATLTKSDLVALYLAAAIHDYDHPYHIHCIIVASIMHTWSTVSRIWHCSTMVNTIHIICSDKAVLEAYHVSSAFKLMVLHPEFNIFASLSKENYRKMRESIIGIVLATDMAGHFAEIAKLKSRLS